MQELIRNNKVIICVGTGGVGKTTISAALGVMAASMGKKSLILTIDPAQRLAQALGIEKNNEISKVKLENCEGELFAGMLSAEETFRRYIENATASKEEASQIIENKLYKQLSSKLSGSQEFTSMLDLLEHSKSGEYDLIILDTPPSQHAIDFLNAPKKIQNLFQNNITEWFSNSNKRTGILSKIFQQSTQMVLGVFEKVTGDIFMKELSNFFLSLNTLQNSIRQNSKESHELLNSDKTAFVMVSSNDRVKVKEAFKLQDKLNIDGYKLSLIIVNQAYPDWLEEVKEGDLEGFEEKIVEYYKERDESYIDLKAEKLNGIEICKIPQFNRDLSGKDGLVFLSKYLK